MVIVHHIINHYQKLSLHLDSLMVNSIIVRLATILTLMMGGRYMIAYHRFFHKIITKDVINQHAEVETGQTYYYEVLPIDKLNQKLNNSDRFRF